MNAGGKPSGPREELLRDMCVRPSYVILVCFSALLMLPLL